MNTIDIAIATCQQQAARLQSTLSDPLPDLNTVEECQRADIGRYWGSAFRFHRDGCWANVTFGERGIVTAFEPDDPRSARRCWTGG